MKNQTKKVILFLCCVLLIGLFAGCNKEDESFRTIEDFKTAKIGIITGSSHEHTVKTNFPDAERIYYKTMADMVIALEQGKIDCFVEDAHFLRSVLWEGYNIVPFGDPVAQVKNGFAFPQGENSRQLREDVNAFLAKSEEDGTIDRLWEKWTESSEPTEHPDYSHLSGENGTIHLAVCIESKPLLYKYKDQCTGFEIELLTLFAEEYGYAFQIEEVPFDSLLAGIGSGKYDMVASSLNITAEREETVDFSDPYGQFDVVLVINGPDGDDSVADSQSPKTMDDLENGVIGVMDGSVYEQIVREKFPNAECQHYSLLPDQIVAVEQGKIDGFVAERSYYTAAKWEGANVDALDEVLMQSNAGFIFPKNGVSDPLREQVSEFVVKSKENGYIDDLMEKWFGSEEPESILDFDSLTGENGTLKIAFAPDLKPVSYYKNETITGYEIELLFEFAKEYGYDLDLESTTFDGILVGVTTGKYDIGSGAVTITEERAQSINFSESHLTMDVIILVKGNENAVAASGGFWGDLKEGFEKTFIRENRWKMIAEGIGVTMLISIFSGIFGTLLGFGLYMLVRSDWRILHKIALAVAKVYSRIVEGTPIVVILMILFYVVFGSFRNISGIFVAIIGFSLTFGAFVYEHTTTSVNSVEKGQSEAAYALGYNKNKTFFRIIFPQAMKVFMPSYCGQAVELIKATAVVGYIAVNDLTKVGDIIRSNTYEAFFPLITTAVIYFILTWIIASLLKIVSRKYEPKRRKAEDILKGVDVK